MKVCSYKLVLLLMFLFSESIAQEQVVLRPSPLAIVTARYKDSYLKVTYSQPQKRGREIFGTLVPYNLVWRTGANEATEITLTKDLFFAGKLVPAGTYSLFSIPDKEKWTIIINKDVGLWGSYNYNPNVDFLRFDVPVQHITNPVYEPFTIVIDQKNNKAEMSLLWDKIKVSFPIDFIEPKS
jgi:hypothetical protein